MLGMDKASALPTVSSRHLLGLGALEHPGRSWLPGPGPLLVTEVTGPSQNRKCCPVGPPGGPAPRTAWVPATLLVQQGEEVKLGGRCWGSSKPPGDLASFFGASQSCDFPPQPFPMSPRENWC